MTRQQSQATKGKSRIKEEKIKDYRTIGDYEVHVVSHRETSPRAQELEAKPLNCGITVLGTMPKKATKWKPQCQSQQNKPQRFYTYSTALVKELQARVEGLSTN